MLTHGDFILSKQDFITDTRRPGVCGSDILVFLVFFLFGFHSSCMPSAYYFERPWIELFLCSSVFPCVKLNIPFDGLNYFVF